MPGGRVVAMATTTITTRTRVVDGTLVVFWSVVLGVIQSIKSRKKTIRPARVN
jgi:hypothetical protein